jgi:hypothetical protein
MKICMVTPAPPRSLTGNRVTALRWARLLGQLGHRVTVVEEYDGQACDLMVALHARKSARSIERLAEEKPGTPIVLALTGTDLYRDVRACAMTKLSLQLAAAIVVLQPEGLREVPDWARARTRGDRAVGGARPRPAAAPGRLRGRAARPPAPGEGPLPRGHGRAPAPGALARARPARGGDPRPDLDERARSEESSNPRYRWLGEMPRWRALRVMARSRLLVITSRSEGGSERPLGGAGFGRARALVAHPRVHRPPRRRLSGALRGGRHARPGRALRARGVGRRVPRHLTSWCRRLAPLVEPARERKAWRELCATACARATAAARTAAPAPRPGLIRGA